MKRNKIEPVDVRIKYKPGAKIPKLARITQTFEKAPSLNIEKKTAEAVQKIISGKDLHRKHIAIAVGSRGIPELFRIVSGLIRELRDAGADPFIVPAMGSHGGATAEGQAAVLQAYGITEETTGIPVISSMEVIQYGETDGVPLYCDANAIRSDGILLINKIKPHTDFHGEIESGLVKMLIIGLGKHSGAAAFHSHGFSNFSRRLQKAYSEFHNTIPLLGGVAVIQDAYDEPALLEGIPSSDILSKEKELLQIAKSKIPSIPVKKADILILDEIGKNISGSGFDPNIFAWERDTEAAPFARTLYDRLYIRSVTEESEGHGTGAYFSDILSLRTVNEIDWGKTWTNCMTLNLTRSHGIPIFLNNDREALLALINCFLPERWPDLKVLRVKNTLTLDSFEASPALWEELRDIPGISLRSDFREPEFNEEGYLKEILL